MGCPDTDLAHGPTDGMHRYRDTRGAGCVPGSRALSLSLSLSLLSLSLLLRSQFFHDTPLCLSRLLVAAVPAYALRQYRTWHSASVGR
eukprot:71904-Rhodomonas_salina.4